MDRRLSKCSGSVLQREDPGGAAPGHGSWREASYVCLSAELCRNVQVLVVPLLAGATGKADVKPLTYVSALMALAGVGLLVERGGVIMPNPGDAWSFASAVFFGIQVGSSLLL